MDVKLLTRLAGMCVMSTVIVVAQNLDQSLLLLKVC